MTHLRWPIYCLLLLLDFTTSSIMEDQPLVLALGCGQDEGYPKPFLSDSDSKNEEESPVLLWQHTILASDNDVSLHFIFLHLPPGDRLILTNNHSDHVVDIHDDKPSGKRHERFFASSVKSRHLLMLQLWRSHSTMPKAPVASSLSSMMCYGFEVDFYRQKAEKPKTKPKSHEEVDNPKSHGEEDEVDSTSSSFSYERLCGRDHTIESACTSNIDPVMHQHAQAIMRLLIHKSAGYDASCTGFLIGCAGHVLTNYHCISNAEEAANTEFEFKAEGQSCSDACRTHGGCPGIVEAFGARLVVANPTLDYVLLQLHDGAALVAKYGHLHFRPVATLPKPQHLRHAPRLEGGKTSYLAQGPFPESKAKVPLEDPVQCQTGDAIYIPQHMNGWGKRISIEKQGGKNATIVSTSTFQCGVHGIAYDADTQGGSSGAPVLSRNDHAVLAIHHCGATCSGTGIPASAIITSLGADLPPCAFEPLKVT